MKRFFPLFLGLSLVLFSFSNTNVEETSLIEDCEINTAAAEELPMLSLIKVCRFHHAVGSTGQTCSPVAAELIVDPNCIGEVKAAVTVTNLHPNPILGNYYQLPATTDQIYFEYTGMNAPPQLIGPIEYYKYTDIKKVGSTPYYLFEAEVIMQFDVSTICPTMTPTFNLQVRILDEQGQVYDIGSEANPSGIFFCQVFEESCNYCSPPPGNCPYLTPGQELVYNVQACGENCGPCGPGKKLQAQNNEAETLGEDTYTHTFVMENTEDLHMEASPNPFSNEINLKFNHRIDRVTSLQIVDMTGKALMLRKNINLNANSILVDTNDIPSGVYFCKVIVDGKMLTKKIIKL